SLPAWETRTAEQIGDFLSFNLYHNRFTREELAKASHVAVPAIEIFDRLSDAADRGCDVAVTKSFDHLRERVAEAAKLFEGLIVAERDNRRQLLAQATAAQTHAEQMARSLEAHGAAVTRLERELQSQSAAAAQLVTEL